MPRSSMPAMPPPPLRTRRATGHPSPPYATTDRARGRSMEIEGKIDPPRHPQGRSREPVHRRHCSRSSRRSVMQTCCPPVAPSPRHQVQGPAPPCRPRRLATRVSRLRPPQLELHSNLYVALHACACSPRRPLPFPQELPSNLRSARSARTRSKGHAPHLATDRRATRTMRRPIRCLGRHRP